MMADAPLLRDVYMAAMGVAYREVESPATPVRVPATWLTCFLMYRAGVSAADIAAATDLDHGTISQKLFAVMALMKFPSFEQRIGVLMRDIPKVFPEDGAAVLPFPGPSILSSAVAVSL